MNLDGNDLAKEVSEKINFPPSSFKLISAGVMIKNDVRLNQQNLKPGQTVMVLTLDQAGTKAMEIERQETDEQLQRLNIAKEDAMR